MECEAVLTPNTMWSFCPSLAASIVFLILFFTTTIVHLVQMIYHRKPYCWVITMSGLWQTLTYIFRTTSIQDPSSFGMYAAWFVLILVAPLWTNAFVYMVFGRLVWNYTDSGQLCCLNASHYGVVFVALDMIAFIIQVYGAAQAASRDEPYNGVLQGLHIYMAGVGVQLLFILIFSVFGLRLFAFLKQARESQRLRDALPLLYLQFAALALIILRIIFRIIEYSSGIDSSIPNHEAFQYCLDSLPMLIALILYNLVHPGRIIQESSGKMPPVWKQPANCIRRRTPERSSEVRLRSRAEMRGGAA